MPMRAASCSRYSEYATAGGLVTSAISPLERVYRLFNHQTALPADGADHECATLIRVDFDLKVRRIMRGSGLQIQNRTRIMTLRVLLRFRRWRRSQPDTRANFGRGAPARAEPPIGSTMATSSLRPVSNRSGDLKPSICQHAQLSAAEARDSRMTDHEVGELIVVAGGDVRSALFDQPQERLAALPRLKLGLTQPFRIFGVEHLIAQCLQIIVINAIELHPKLQDGDRDQLRRVPIARREQCDPALLQLDEHRKHLFV
jgi:hypothetical protein